MRKLNDIMKTVKSLEESGLLIKCVSRKLKMKQRKKRGFVGMLLGKVRASLLGNLLHKEAESFEILKILGFFKRIELL